MPTCRISWPAPHPPPAPPASGRGEEEAQEPASESPSPRRGEGRGEGVPPQPDAAASGRTVLQQQESRPGLSRSALYARAVSDFVARRAVSQGRT